MTLDEYLRTEGLTEKAFAKIVGVSQPHVHRYRTGESWPSRDAMIRIREATDYQVTSEDFLPPPPERRTPLPRKRET